MYLRFRGQVTPFPKPIGLPAANFQPFLLLKLSGIFHLPAPNLQEWSMRNGDNFGLITCCGMARLSNAQQYGEPITVSTDARGDLHLYALAEFDRRNAKSETGERYPQYLALERKYEFRVPNPEDAAPGQLNYQSPAATANGFATVTISANNINVTGAINVAEAYPSLFMADARGAVAR